MTTRTAAIVLIGNELLSGKIEDLNARHAIGKLRELGVELTRLAIVPDEKAAIVDEVRRVSTACDVVFTSGGVGPTHDDITLACIAAAFDQPLVRNAQLAQVLEAHFGDRLRPEHLRMADLPSEATLVDGGKIRWPVVQVRNVFVLPGVPSLFRDKFDAICERFRSGRFYLRSVYLDADEGEIAALLERLEAEHGVSIGSYPRWGDPAFRIRVTFEARSIPPVNAAVNALVAALEEAQIRTIDPIL